MNAQNDNPQHVSQDLDR